MDVRNLRYDGRDIPDLKYERFSTSRVSARVCLGEPGLDGGPRV